MKLSTIAQDNKDIALTGERLVVVGGTQGIGEGVACRFAKAGAAVWIVGRNEAKASLLLERLQKISAEMKVNPRPEHLFLRADLSLISEAKRLAAEIHTRAGSQGIEYLVMTQGGPPNGTFIPTSEGQDQNYAVQVLSRWIIAHKLSADPGSSVVKKAVMSIMSPGQSWTTVDPDDLELEKARTQGTCSIVGTASRDTTIVDSFTQDLAVSNPNITFTHIFPGFVKTGVIQNSAMPWYFAILTWMLTVFIGASADDYAELPFHLLAHPKGQACASREMYINHKLDRKEPAVGIRDKNLRDKIRSYLLGIVNSK